MVRRDWSQEETDLLIYLKEVEGASWETITERLGRSYGSVRGRYIRLKRDSPTEAIADGQEEMVHFAEDGNYATATSRSRLIQTLDQLLEACKVDLAIWRVDHYLVNAWPGWARRREKDLTFTAGVIEGTVKEGGIVTTQLYQVKAWLVRIKPIPVFPPIEAIRLDVTFPAPAPPKREALYSVKDKTIGRSLVAGDPHFGFYRDTATGELVPFHDWRVLDVALQLAILAEVGRVDLLGDTFDLPDWSDRFLASPDFQAHTQPALIDAHLFLHALRRGMPGAIIKVHEGNHDRRLYQAIVRHLPAAYGLKPADEMHLPPSWSVPRLLALHNLGIEWIDNYPDDEDWLNSALRLSHGEKARVPGSTAKAVVADSEVTEIFGHIHRQEMASRTMHLRDRIEVRQAFCPGCLCHIDGRVPSRRAKDQWQNGVAIVDYEIGGVHFNITPVIIMDGRAIWNGQIVESRDEDWRAIRDAISSGGAIVRDG